VTLLRYTVPAGRYSIVQCDPYGERVLAEVNDLEALVAACRLLDVCGRADVEAFWEREGRVRVVV
jgi:hypothetical protein